MADGTNCLFLCIQDRKKRKGTKMPKNPKSPAQPDNNEIAYDNANNLSKDDDKPWNIYVSGTQSEEENEGKFYNMFHYYHALDSAFDVW
jgi:hypothetical protein